MSQISPQSSHPSGDARISSFRRLRRLSHILDNAIPIPGTSYRIGIDPLIGLLPGGGDFFGTAVSAYIVLEAARMGVPRETLVQMVWNIIVDTLSGTVPVLGDLVDVTWKANTKNIVLLEEHLKIPPSPTRKKVDWLFLALLFGVLLLVVVGVAAISVMLLRWLFSAITG
ncbi:DUF4112 domain-containing protein [Microcoleus sp. FACHB-53]|nr:DUF4112 domain-containing protein [Microcoleus sp. FACHB-53]MBD2129747.1 DUF4112 domain-containing protein [Microcoleus sp. FACHB-1]